MPDRRWSIWGSDLNSRSRLVIRASLLIAVFFGLDKIVALARSVVIARVFGVSAVLDSFNAANNLPDLLFVLISGGALAIAFIPVLSEYFDQHGRESGWEVFSLVANLAFVVTGALAVVVAIFALPIVRSEFGIAPGFDIAQQQLVAELMRLNLIATLVFSISGLIIGGLQANQHFLLPALAPSMYNFGQMFGALVLAPEVFPFFGLPIPTLGLGVHGLVYGVILGALLHLGVQLPGLARHGFRWTPGLNLRHPGVAKVLALMGPRIVALGAFQATELIRDNLASRLGEGSVTALTFGWFIMQVPETIIGTAIGTALLPTLSTLAAKDDLDSLRSTLTGAVRAMTALTLPAAVALLFLARPFVRLLFEGRAFTAEDTSLVVFAAQMFLVGLVGHSLLEIAARTFFARQDAVTPTVVATAAMGVQVVLSLTLVRVPALGYAGLALSNSLAFTLQAITLLVILYFRLRAFDADRVLRGVGKVAVAGAVTAVALAAAGGVLHSRGPMPQALGGVAVAVSVYVGVAMLLRLEEVRQLPALVWQQIRSPH